MGEIYIFKGSQKFKSNEEFSWAEDLTFNKEYEVQKKINGFDFIIDDIGDTILIYDDRKIFFKNKNVKNNDSTKIDSLVKKIEKWSKDKGLDKAESSKQMLKVIEEVGEVASALAKNKQDELKDGIGDVVVTLVILSQQNGLDLTECVETAYNVIAGRTGKMINGVFVKSEDLK